MKRDVKIRIEPRLRGSYVLGEGGFPVRFGERAMIESDEVRLELDLAGRLRYLTGTGPEWPEPNEYLKRTDADDWVYYSLGQYADLYSLYGERYLPCPDYPTNRPLGGEPFRRAEVQRALAVWRPLLRELAEDPGSVASEHRALIQAAARRNEPRSLARRAEELHDILGATIPVLPPDSRVVDYDVVPLVVADGCRYGCRFCRVKGARSAGAFTPRARPKIEAQLERLRGWLGPRRGDYPGLFLGLNDALGADEDLLRWAIEAAYRTLGFEESSFSRPALFLFGSVHSLLARSAGFWRWLDRSPWATFVNVGLEAADDATLRELGKPLLAAEVSAAFGRMVEINRLHQGVEVTANFIWREGDQRAEASMIELLSDHLDRPVLRGACYLSVLMLGDERPRAVRRDLLRRVYALQRASPAPLYLYLVQRL